MNRLFEIGKIGVFVDGYAPKIEKRNGEEVSCLTVHCRIQPFDAKLATALDEGVGDDSNIRATVFQMMGDAKPKPNFTRHDFKLAMLPPQNLLIFPHPDKDAHSRVALTQALIRGCYVRTQKDVDAVAFCFKATFGPVGRDQLELVHSLFRKQTHITFEAGEPLLSVEAEEEDDAPEGVEELGAGKAPMWEAEDEPEPVGAGASKGRRKARA